MGGVFEIVPLDSIDHGILARKLQVLSKEKQVFRLVLVCGGPHRPGSCPVLPSERGSVTRIGHGLLCLSTGRPGAEGFH